MTGIKRLEILYYAVPIGIAAAALLPFSNKRHGFDARQARPRATPDNCLVPYLFESRTDAGRRLAKALAAHRGLNPLVLAIPRGAVEVGAVIAEALGGELDVVLVRKLRSPFSPELAVGAVDESGWTYVADHAPMMGGTPDHLARERRAQLETLACRRAQYTPARIPADPRGRIAIVVDDGIATGATMMAALHSVRTRHPARLICAVPVASRESIEQVGPYADEVVCLEMPDDFEAVGQFYRSFPQVEDDDVVRLLALTRKPAEKALR